MSDQPKKEWKYLARKPGSNYRQLIVKGRNIWATTLYSLYVGDDPPMTVEEVAAEYDNLPVEAVREAIEYCESNPPEIREDWEMDERMAEATGMNHPDYKYNPAKYYKVLSPEERARIRRGQ